MSDTRKAFTALDEAADKRGAWVELSLGGWTDDSKTARRVERLTVRRGGSRLAVVDVKRMGLAQAAELALRQLNVKRAA